eukprot:4841634-Pyramimonas_sp.AAC.1
MRRGVPSPGARKASGRLRSSPNSACTQSFSLLFYGTWPGCRPGCPVLAVATSSPPVVWAWVSVWRTGARRRHPVAARRVGLAGGLAAVLADAA